MPALIFEDVIDLKAHIDSNYEDFSIYATSGGFDPLHVGHLRCIQGTADMACGESDLSLPMGIVVVIVNGDGFLERKKGFSFMPHNERLEIAAGVEGVDFVVGWDDGSQFVTEALRCLKPDFFTKGGDRTDKTTVPEFSLCEEIGCRVIFNVGGGKVQSSSELVKNAQEKKKSSHI